MRYQESHSHPSGDTQCQVGVKIAQSYLTWNLQNKVEHSHKPFKNNLVLLVDDFLHGEIFFPKLEKFGI